MLAASKLNYILQLDVRQLIWWVNRDPVVICPARTAMMIGWCGQPTGDMEFIRT